MGLFNKPPKTTIENYILIPHLEKLLLWFLKNDPRVAIVASETITQLFSEGYLPDSLPDNDPKKLLEDQSAGEFKIENQLVWIYARLWLDLVVATKAVEEQGIEFDKALEGRIDVIEKQTADTLLRAGELVVKYGLDPVVKDLDKELSKILTEEERETFKKNYLADTLVSTEARLLGWIYKDLFKKDYKIKK